MEYIFIGLKKNVPEISIVGIFLIRKVEYFWNDQFRHDRRPGLYIKFVSNSTQFHFEACEYYSSGELNEFIASHSRLDYRSFPIEKLHSFYPHFSQELDKQVTLALLRHS